MHSTPLGRGSAAKSSGWKRSRMEQMRDRDKPGKTSALMVRSVSTSLGIISKSAVALNWGKKEYLQHMALMRWYTEDI